MGLRVKIAGKWKKAVANVNKLLPFPIPAIPIPIPIPQSQSQLLDNYKLSCDWDFMSRVKTSKKPDCFTHQEDGSWVSPPVCSACSRGRGRRHLLLYPDAEQLVESVEPVHAALLVLLGVSQVNVNSKSSSRLTTSFISVKIRRFFRFFSRNIYKCDWITWPVLFEGF